MAILLVSSIIAVSVASGLLALVLFLAFLGYCYRRREIQGNYDSHGRNSVTPPHLRQNSSNYDSHSIKSATPPHVRHSSSVDHGHIGVIPWQAGASYPRAPVQRGTYHKQHVHLKRYAGPPPKIILSNPSFGNRRVFVHHKYPSLQHIPPRGKSGVPHSTFHTQGHFTTPLIRLGTYKPKVIQGSIDPQNIRDHDQPLNLNTTVSSHPSSERDLLPPQHLYEKYKSKNGIRWRKKRYEEKSSVVYLDYDDVHDYGPPGLDEQTNGELNSGSAVVIVDYLDTDNREEKHIPITDVGGPLSTSTPRNLGQETIIIENRSNSDSGLNIINEKDNSKDGNVTRIAVH